MNRQEFHALLERYITGKSTEAEKELVNQWYELLDDADLPSVSSTELETIEHRLWEKIQSTSTDTPVRKINLRWIAVAATIAAVLLIPAAYWWSTHRTGQQVWYAGIAAVKTMKQQVNTTQKIMTVQLEDGSKITLYPGASVSYPQHFETARREVYLEGQGFFEVHKNPHQPFYVYSQNIVTHVLGTSFMIMPDKEKGLTSVAVSTGRVEVTGKNEYSNNGIILTPNQQVVYNIRENHFEASLVEKPAPLPAVAGSISEKQLMTFEDAPLQQVLAAIGKQYGIEIIEENENLDNCPFTGDISGQSLYNKLDLVCLSVKATYEIKGTKILIRGKGCN
ncbi:MAG: FecR domain-containing protein [Chitinophagaceae bacterium]